MRLSVAIKEAEGLPTYGALECNLVRTINFLTQEQYPKIKRYRPLKSLEYGALHSNSFEPCTVEWHRIQSLTIEINNQETRDLMAHLEEVNVRLIPLSESVLTA